MSTAGRWSWKLKFAKECVTTHLPNQSAPKMDGAQANLSNYATDIHDIDDSKQGGGAIVQKLQVQTLMEQSVVQILVGVANIHPKFMNAEVEKSSMSTSLEHGLPGPKTNCNYFKRQFQCHTQMGIRLIFLKYLLWC